MATALHRCCDSLRSAARTARRQRLHTLGQRYDRARHLPAILPEFADRPGHPFARLSPDGALALRRGDRDHTRRIGRGLVRRLRVLLRQRRQRDLDRNIDLLRIALCGEWRLYQRQRAELALQEVA